MFFQKLIPRPLKLQKICKWNHRFQIEKVLDFFAFQNDCLNVFNPKDAAGLRSIPKWTDQNQWSILSSFLIPLNTKMQYLWRLHRSSTTARRAGSFRHFPTSSQKHCDILSGSDLHPVCPSNQCSVHWYGSVTAWRWMQHFSLTPRRPPLNRNKQWWKVAHHGRTCFGHWQYCLWSFRGS